jgi:hypothetical protein
VIKVVAVACVVGMVISALIIWKLALLLGGGAKGQAQNSSLAPFSRAIT